MFVFRRYKDHENLSLLKKIKMLCQHCFNTLQIPEDFHCYSKTPVGKEEQSPLDSGNSAIGNLNPYNAPSKASKEQKKAYAGGENSKLEIKVMCTVWANFWFFKF